MFYLETNSSFSGSSPIACYKVYVGENLLGGEKYQNNTMTKYSCLDFCKRGMYSYAGLYQGAHSCLCGDSRPDESRRLTGPGLDCDRTCQGDINTPNTGGCGGARKMSFYKL